jgi:hypothetical protein
MCDSSEASKKAIVVKYNECLKRFDDCYSVLEEFSKLYNYKDVNKIPDEPHNEFFDKLNNIFKIVESNFVKAREDYVKAREDYNNLNNKFN